MKVIYLETAQVLDLMGPLFQLNHKMAVPSKALVLLVDIVNGTSFSENASILFQISGSIFKNSVESQLYKRNKFLDNAFVLKRPDDVSNLTLEKRFEAMIDLLVDHLLGGVSPLEEDEYTYLRYRSAYRKMVISSLELIKRQFKL